MSQPFFKSETPPLFAQMDEPLRFLLLAALSLYDRAGRQGATLAAVSQECGVPLPEVQAVFPTDEDLHVRLFLEGLWAHQDMVLARLKEAPTAQEGVTGILHAHVDWTEHHTALARFVNEGQPKKGDPLVKQQRKGRNRIYGQQVAAWFAPHVQSGQLRPLSPELYHAFLFAPAQEWSANWLRGKSRVTPAEARKVFAETVWAALKGPHA